VGAAVEAIVGQCNAMPPERTPGEPLRLFQIARFDQPQAVLGTIRARSWQNAILIHRFQRLLGMFPEEACLREVRRRATETS
jgi:hypothetical protein